MKSTGPPSAAIFFMTYFYKAGGIMAPLRPLPSDPLLVAPRATNKIEKELYFVKDEKPGQVVCLWKLLINPDIYVWGGEGAVNRMTDRQV